ncbi:hypothetical protein BDZ85DRAFT_284814 [Elsinoe ampelina]|uniref:Uncharacterized protein n=1 Tax=Elsinoe ampelina TaxID=302913 RepID=A0A6A6G272_9PEZI|nr:hypothetical protein BDZ85DRAFT_284814 [Elsinoe ampelina]
MNLCARTLIRNLPLIQEEHIDALPPHIPAAIYSALCSSSLLPLRATQLFAPVSPTPTPHPIRLRLASPTTTTLKDRLALLEQNQSRLLHFLANLHSPSSRWVVSIHLTGLLPWTSLMQLGLMENLRVLWLGCAFEETKDGRGRGRGRAMVKEFLREGTGFMGLRGLVVEEGRGKGEVVREMIGVEGVRVVGFVGDEVGRGERGMVRKGGVGRWVAGGKYRVHDERKVGVVDEVLKRMGEEVRVGVAADIGPSRREQRRVQCDVVREYTELRIYERKLLSVILAQIIEPAVNDVGTPIIAERIPRALSRPIEVR